MDLERVKTVADDIRREVGKAIVGQDEAIELMLTSLLSGGHVLIEGVPGTGKTLLAQCFAATLSLHFGRIQFTPDMMPGDVLGTSLFNFQTGGFTLTPGPIFTQILLADEVNRTPPKTQAALLQAMNERVVTIDTETHGLGPDFMVVATQNPIEQHGTYPLPEAQLDRFLFKINLGYPTRDEERAIVTRHGHQSSMPKIEDYGVTAVIDANGLAALRAFAAGIRLSPEIVDYIVDVMRATREHPAIESGGSTRAANMLASAVRSYAALSGRDFVIPDDVKRLSIPLVRHRITMAAHAEIDGFDERSSARRDPRANGRAAMMRPTSRAVGVFSASVPIGFLILVWSQALWPFSFVFSLVALAAVVIDAVTVLRRRRLGVAVTEPARLPIGQTGFVSVELTTDRYPGGLRLTALLEQTGPGELPAPRTGKTVEGKLVLALPVMSKRRGLIGLEALWVCWRGPLGLVEQRMRQALARTIDVVPVARSVRGEALKFLTHDAQFGSKMQQQRGEGSEFETLRDHVPGLDNRHIDWKRSARHNTLLSKVFRTERNHQIVLAFDTGHLMVEPIETMARLDHAIEAALLLAWVSLKSGDLVGSFAFDAHVRQYLAPAGGLAYLTRLQQGVARLDYRTEETNFTLGLAELNLRLKRRALVVLFTEFVDTVTAELLMESVQRIANRHAVIFVTLQDPMMSQLIHAEPDDFEAIAETVIANDLQRDRAIVLERIARMGVDILDVPVGGLALGLVNKYLAAKQRGRI